MQWHGHRLIEELVKNTLDVNWVRFVRNNYPGGDLYEIELKDTDCPEFFTLRTGVRPVDKTNTEDDTERPQSLPRKQVYR